MAAFLVRVAREADHEALLATTVALNRFEHEITGDRAIDVASAEAVLGHFIRRVGSTGLMLVAEAEGRVIGHLFLALDEAPPYLAPEYRREAWICDAFVEEAWRGKGAFRAWTPEMLADYIEDGFHDTPSGEVELNCPPAWEASNFASHGHDPWPSFQSAGVPIRILKAETGSTCRSDGHEAGLTADGRIRLEVIPGTTHFLPMERPDLVRQTLTDLVAG